MKTEAKSPSPEILNNSNNSEAEKVIPPVEFKCLVCTKA